MIQHVLVCDVFFFLRDDARGKVFIHVLHLQGQHFTSVYANSAGASQLTVQDS